MAHPHAARLTARGAGEVAAAGFRSCGGRAAGRRGLGVGGSFRSCGGSAAGLPGLGTAKASAAAGFRGGEVFGTLEEEGRVGGGFGATKASAAGFRRAEGARRVGGGFGATKASAAAGFRRAEGARRVPRVGGDTDWWWLGSRGLCGGGGSRVDGASGRLFPGGVWRRFFDVIEAAQASYTQAGGNRLLRGACLDAAGKSGFCGGQS
ncbi:hypothetical protein B5F90_08975 [Alistipes sp. An31A]|nr:hypothetical protein B5F90_08975 [Alistipes sp. An31A]